MALHQAAKDETSKISRKRGGLVVKTLRTRAKLTQRELAVLAGIEYYTFISQIESGTGRVPPPKYAAFASALGCNTKLFVRELIKYYDPDTFEVLFDAKRNEPTDYPSLLL